VCVWGGGLKAWDGGSTVMGNMKKTIAMGDREVEN